MVAPASELPATCGVSPQKPPSTPRRVLLTGATGYVGGRLLRRLESRGLPLRCVVRRPEHLRGRVAPATEVVAGDVLSAASLDAPLAGIATAYYLIHSMGAGGSFIEKDRQAAGNFAAAARRQGVARIIYLGGLGDVDQPLSDHLRSRIEVGEILRASGVPVIELRASIVLGSGSLSFEMIRALVERLPIMVTPRWVAVRAQPIAIDDLLDYLLAAGELPVSGSRIYEVGGRDAVSYGELMREYARQRRLRRLMIPVPLLTPRLSSLWLGLVTPLYAAVGRELIEGLRHPTVVQDEAALQDFPVRPCGVREAIARAQRNEDRDFAETRWSDALSTAGGQPDWGGVRFGSRIVDSRRRWVAAPAQAAFDAIQRIGGRRGWYAFDFLWRLRGWLDLLAGGVGMRRGRRDPVRLQVGDPLDCWRVEGIEPGRGLRLRAEMKLPGRAWLVFEVSPDPAGEGAAIRQTALFDPVGLAGILYWYALYPLHQLVFAGMLRGVARAAEQAAAPRGGG